MSGFGSAGLVTGLCVALAAGSVVFGPAWAGSPGFVGKWHWNRAQSTQLPGEPVPDDIVAEISRVDGTHVRWSLTVLTASDETTVETFDMAADGEFHAIDDDMTAAFRLTGSALKATFKRSTGETDALTCTLDAGQRKMTCQGVLTGNDGRTTNYVDVYDRMLPAGRRTS